MRGAVERAFRPHEVPQACERLVEDGRASADGLCMVS